MKPRMNKKGILGQLGDIFQQLAFIGIFGAVILVILASLQSSISYGEAIQNASKSAIGNVTLSLGNTFGQFPLFGTILGLMLIIGLVFIMFRGKGSGGSI